jgi:hypothetical protein
MPTLFHFIKVSGLNGAFHTVVLVAIAKCTEWYKLFWDKSQEKLYVLVRKQIRKMDKFDGFTTATAAYKNHTESIENLDKVLAVMGLQVQSKLILLMLHILALVCKNRVNMFCVLLLA